MIIKSPYKDYYDYVSNFYGVDEKFIYIRDRFDPTKINAGLSAINVVNSNEFMINLSPSYLKIRDTPSGMYYRKFRKSGNNANDKEMDWKFRWISVAGKYRLLGSNEIGSNEYSLCTEDHLVMEHLKKRKVKRDYYMPDETSPELILLSRQLNAPVFMILDVTWKVWPKVKNIHINTKIPILSAFGFPKIYSPEQMYQEIYHFIANVMHDSPDSMPDMKPPLSDKEKAVNHGFDLKSSFRHRKSGS
jgi:hypothetical protein